MLVRFAKIGPRHPLSGSAVVGIRSREPRAAHADNAVLAMRRPEICRLLAPRSHEDGPDSRPKGGPALFGAIDGCALNSGGASARKKTSWSAPLSFEIRSPPVHR